MTPLRQKMVDLMTFRQYSPKTHQAYLSIATQLAAHYQRSPEQISIDEIKHWLIQTANEREWSSSTTHQATHALKFLYHEVLEYESTFIDILLPKRTQKSPVLLTQSEVYSIPSHANDLKKLTLLNLLRQYWQAWHPNYYLFCRYQQKKPMHITSVQKIFTQVKNNAGIHKKGGIHSLRHAYATHQLEQGLPIHQLKHFLGHSDISVTMKYLHWLPESQVLASDLLEQFTPDKAILQTSFKGDSHDVF